jgi:kanamycin kinase
MEIAGVPTRWVRAPREVEALAQGDPVSAVWENQVGGLTFRIGEPIPRAYVKWAPAGSRVDLAVEAERMRWAGQFTAVPHILDVGSSESGSWLLTRAVNGESAVSRRWAEDPLTAVRGIGSGLRSLHDALPVDDCPFSWSVQTRTAGLSAGVVSELPPIPPVDKLVVCHGDACAPNTLLDENGQWIAHVDFGSLGLPDRWADIAAATWSTEWNYGPGFEDALLDAYGVDPDPVRTEFYRALWGID